MGDLIWFIAPQINELYGLKNNFLDTNSEQQIQFININNIFIKWLGFPTLFVSCI